MSLDSIHGAIFMLEILSVLNSVVLIVVVVLLFYQMRELSNMCTQLKNWLVVQSRRSHKAD